jgi:hypothetical protein
MMEAAELGGIKEEYVDELLSFTEIEIDGKVYLPFVEFLSILIKKREESEKGSFKNLLYKLMINGLYGKVSQGIETRTFFNLEGEKESLKPSRISCSHYSSHITALIRIAVGKMINVINS